MYHSLIKLGSQHPDLRDHIEPILDRVSTLEPPDRSPIEKMEKVQQTLPGYLDVYLDNVSLSELDSMIRSVAPDDDVRLIVERNNKELVKITYWKRNNKTEMIVHDPSYLHKTKVVELDGFAGVQDIMKAFERAHQVLMEDRMNERDRLPKNRGY